MPIIIPSPAATYTNDSLWYIRQKVAELSGRYDLITSEGNDAGLDFFIQAGLKFLDRQLDIERLTARDSFDLSAGENTVRIPRTRIIKRVKVTDVYGVSITLSKITNDEYQELVKGGDVTGDRSLYYVPHSLRTVEEVYDYQTEPIVSAIKIFPTPIRDLIVEVYGNFYSRPLVENTDRNFWSVHYPELLIQSSLLQIEKFMRNTEGVNDQLNALMLDIRQLDFDHVSQQIVDVDQMEG